MRSITLTPSWVSRSSSVQFCGKRLDDEDDIIPFPGQEVKDSYGKEELSLQAYHRFSVADLVEAANVQQKPMAMVALAGRYESGIKRPVGRAGIFQPGLEVEKDLAKAETLYRQAAKLNPTALFHLGRFLMLEKPKGFLSNLLKLGGKLPTDTLEGAALLQLFANRTTMQADRMNAEHLIEKQMLSFRQQAEVNRKVTALEEEYPLW